MLKVLPIGLQSFETIRKNDFIYIDKTKHLLNLIRKPGNYFLSRPRR
ncbi:AAA family ATPase, partial [bacterium]|nr:AAA family ATPase [bacterium]